MKTETDTEVTRPDDKEEHEVVEIDASNLYYKDLNRLIKDHAWSGKTRFRIKNAYGQRYIGTGVEREVHIDIVGTPGNDLAAFMDGPTIHVRGNAQDGVGNTMNEGTIVIHGHGGDIAGYGMRGGSIYVKEDVGYRVGIHMKEYFDKVPVMVIGGTAQDFLGEYMAGGRLVILGLNLDDGEPHKANFIGTGMHGGILYIRGHIEDHQLGKEVSIVPLDDKDHAFLDEVVTEYCKHFGGDKESILKGKFLKLLPLSKRPYGRIYAY
jgi:glutamate synthase domain-containing protein 3